MTATILSTGNNARTHQPVYARDWFVDSVNGNDGFNGKTPIAPFATIAKLLTVMQAGDSVGLARGSTWREKFNVSTKNNVVIGPYGSGADPLLDCSVEAVNASFIKTGGQVNVYQIAVTVDFSASEPMWNSVWENDVRLVRAASIANCDATPGSYFPSNDNNANVTLYVHASDSSDVIVNGKVYEYARWLSGFTSWNATGIGLNGIRSRRNLANNGSIEVGKTSIVYGCTAEEGNKHNVLIRTGCWVENVTATNAYYAGGSAAMFVYNEDTPANEGVTFLGCIAQITNGYLTNIQGFYGHYNVGGSFGTVAFTNCSAINLFSGYNGINANLVYTNCITTGCTNNGWSINTTGTVAINGCANTITNASGLGIVIITAGVITITGHTFTCSVAKTSQAAIQSGMNNVNLTIAGTTTFSGFVYGINWYAGVGGTINISGADFINMTRNYDTLVGGPVITSDFNHFFDAGQDFRIQGTLYNNVADYQVGTGQDANSTVGP